MDIKYLGHSSFLIKTKSAKIVTDPFSPESTGLKFPKQETDIVTSSHDHKDHNYIDGVKGELLILTWPGEFEKKEVHITGFPTYHDAKSGAERGGNVMYKFEDDDLSLLHCGDLGHVLDDSLIEQIGNVDILMVPVGGVYTITPQEAVKLVRAIEPGIVIPMHFGRPELPQDIYGDMQDLAVFLKAIGAEDTVPVEKLSIKKENLNPEQTQVVVLAS